MSNSKFASLFLIVLFAAFYLISLIPDGTLPTWAQLVLGAAIGLIARVVLIARMDAQDRTDSLR